MEPKLQENGLLGASAPNKPPFIERGINKLEKWIFVINNVMHKVSSLFLFVLMFLTTADVIGRYFLNKPITGTYEITGLALALIIFFSLGMTQINKEHIEIDFLTKKLPVRIQESLHALTSFILFVLVLLMTWQLLEYTKRVWSGNELSGDLGIPLYIFVFLTVIGAFGFSLTLLLDTLKSIMKAVKKNES